MSYSMNTEVLLPISEYQKRFFLEWALNPDDTSYNQSLIYKISGDLNIAYLKQACECLTQQHEVVHARYDATGTRCFYQNYTIDDFFHILPLDSSCDVMTQLCRLIDRPFDLTEDVLLQFYLLQTDANEFYFIVNAHHIVCDAQSAVILIQSISNHYQQLACGDYQWSQLDKTFSKAVQKKVEALTDEYVDKASQYWKNFIDDMPLSVSLPYQTRDNQSILGDTIYFELTEEEIQSLKSCAKRNKTTIFITLAALYGFIIAKYSHQEQFLLSYPINLRPLGFSDVTGCFINNLLLKIDLG